MKLGMLSDTHGRFEIARRAVGLLQAAGATHFVHCGDVGGGRVLDTMAGLPAYFVFGNNDDDADDLERYGNALGLVCLRAGGTFDLAGRRVAVAHGDRPSVIERLLSPADRVDYLLTGHSHVRHDRTLDGVRRINPGALYRATVKSVAVLDPASGALEFIEVPDAP